MNLELHILVGQPRTKDTPEGKRELKIIGTAVSRSELQKVAAKVKASDYVFLGEVRTNKTSLKNRRHLPLPEPEKTEPEKTEPEKTEPEKKEPPKA